MLTAALLVSLLSQDSALDRLIRQLGAEEYIEREEAMEQLIKLGTKALPALKKAAGSRNLEVAARVRHLLRLLESFRIKKAALCKRVNGLRDYVPLEGNTFSPGDRLFVYLEMHNFTLKPIEDRFGFHLHYTWELFDNLIHQMARAETSSTSPSG